MGRKLTWAVGLGVLWAVAACGPGGSTKAPAGGTAPAHPLVVGHWTYYGSSQALPADVHDVSADEGGNVYVAGFDALYVKKAGEADFARVDPDAAGLTRNCWPESEIANRSPGGEPFVCPIISVAGAAPGKAIVGLKGVGIDDDYTDAPWALDSGGMDVVTFDGKSVRRERHVLVASPPKTACYVWDNSDPSVPKNTVCAETWSDSPWMAGRRKMRQIQRIVVNHDRSRPLSYGDVYMAGTHGTFAILVANPEDRGWYDRTQGYPSYADARHVWEHHHPDPESTTGAFLAGEAWALAVDPRNNVPWFANQFRIASMPGYVELKRPVVENNWWGDQVPERPHLALWYGGSPQDPSRRDNVSSLSFCTDGTLWVASAGNGLARIDPAGGGVSFVDLPAGLGNVAFAVACDPADASVWVGFGWGGFGRYKDGRWWTVDATAPKFASSTPVRSIQIDRWSSPRVVWFAHQASRSGPGGVTAYSGP